MRLLVFFFILGVAGDIFVWILRWRPHWAWFRKKRIVVNDERLLAGEKQLEEERRDGRPDRVFHVQGTQRRSAQPVVRRGKTENTRIPPRGSQRTSVQRKPVVVSSEDKKGEEDIFEVGDGPLARVYSEDKIFNVKTLENPRRNRSDMTRIPPRTVKRRNGTGRAERRR